MNDRPQIDYAVLLRPLLEPLLSAFADEIERRVRVEMDTRLAQMYGALLTEREAAKKLNVSRETMRQLRLSNRIEAIYIGASVRYSRAAVDALIESRATKPRGRRRPTATS